MTPPRSLHISVYCPWPGRQLAEVVGERLIEKGLRARRR